MIITPQQMNKELRRYHVPRRTFAKMIGVSESMLSLWSAGKRPLSNDVQHEMWYAIEYLGKVVIENELPIDFSNLDEILPHWKKFRGEKVIA